MYGYDEDNGVDVVTWSDIARMEQEPPDDEPDGRFWINGVAFEDTEPWMRPVTQRSAERIEMGDRVTAWLRRGEDLGSVWGVVAVVRP